MAENFPAGKSSILAQLTDPSKPGRWWSDDALAEHDREVAVAELKRTMLDATDLTDALVAVEARRWLRRRIEAIEASSRAGGE